MPASVEMPARNLLDYWLGLMAPQRDGLTWIDVNDPQLRKADKLNTSTR